ncbi:MAG: hypothetical protein GY694_17185 [Gammaproteobacteria bacterium]|nr:hypothetical protein [Gammaproteobacteria bacterium]
MIIKKYSANNIYYKSYLATKLKVDEKVKTSPLPDGFLQINQNQYYIWFVTKDNNKSTYYGNGPVLEVEIIISTFTCENSSSMLYVYPGLLSMYMMTWEVEPVKFIPCLKFTLPWFIKMDFHWYATIRLDIDTQSLTHLSNINISMSFHCIYIYTPFGEICNINDWQRNTYDDKIKLFKTGLSVRRIQFVHLENHGSMHTHRYGVYVLLI